MQLAANIVGHYDATTGRWMCIDPMAEKYYDVSPYAYCKNNPVNRIDPNGKEVIDFLYTQNTKQDISKQNFFNRWHDNNAIILMGHGAENGKYFIYPCLNGYMEFISHETYSKIDDLLEDYSQVWNSRWLSSQETNIVFFSCDTGSNNGLAMQLSSQKKFYNVSIFAPSEAVNIAGDGSVFIDNGGVWREYINGKIVNEYSGNIVPGTNEFEKSTYWDKMPQINYIW